MDLAAVVFPAFDNAAWVRPVKRKAGFTMAGLSLSTSLPHSLDAARDDLVNELQECIRQFKEHGRYSNGHEIYKAAEGFVHELCREPAWRDELERSARFASVSADGSNVCASTVDGKVQIWDRTRDERLVARAAPPVADLQALDNGCLVLIEGGEVKRLDPSGSWDTLHVGGTAIARSGSDILVAAGPEVFVHAGTGELLSSHPADVGVTALSRIGSRLLLGYREGRIEQLSTPSDPVLAREFEDVPASAVVRLIPGPMGTVIAGYASGDLGIWSLDDGVRLYGSHLHGPLVHLQQANGELHVASELGWSDVLDLGVFEMDYCDLMREVWAAVPVVWENGRPVPREPPATHRCQP